MKLSKVAVALVVVLSSTITVAFVPQALQQHRQYPQTLSSTLAPTDNARLDNHQSDDNDDDKISNKQKHTVGALSMGLDELGQALGGKGRAQLVWDCYRIGIDPIHFHGSKIHLGYDDYESIYQMLPSQRRNQKLGTPTLERLASLYPSAGKIEGGVATLSYISRSGDSTTKILLKLADGLEVETVIIPWKGGQSTLCISSQVGCRQGTWLYKNRPIL